MYQAPPKYYSDVNLSKPQEHFDYESLELKFGYNKIKKGIN